MKLSRFVVLLLPLLLAAGSHLAAQVPVVVPDSVLLDSLRSDSLRKLGDTVSTTDRLLAGERNLKVQLNPLPRCGAAPVHPNGVMRHFNRDSIDWITASNLSDILATIPGVFIERADWLGGPDIPNYMGRGAASVEYVVDCVPQVALGTDSVAYDPSVFPLNFLDQVDVEVSPGSLRVYIFTRTHNRQAPRTKVAVAQGDRGVSHYFGSYESRHASGIGLSLGADYASLNPKGPQGGGNSLPSGWVQLSYAPTPRMGIQAQMLTQSISRNLLLNDAKTDTLLRPQVVSRMDLQLRGSWRQRTDGFGGSLDLIAATTRSSANFDSLPFDSLGKVILGAVDTVQRQRDIGQYGAIVGWRMPSWSAQLATWHYTRWTSLDSRLDLGWAPRENLSASVQLAAQLHENSRHSEWATGTVGMLLPFGLHAEGTFSDGQRVQTPTILTDQAQSFSDASLTAGFRSHPFTAEAGYTSDHGWRPAAFSEFVAITSLAPLERTDWITVHARYAPVGFLTFETFYQHPQHHILVDGSPPQHALSTATLRSRFLRNFPSGIFQLKLQGVIETWSPGIGGRDSTGAPITLGGATFVRSIFQLQLGPFIAFYDRVNYKIVRSGYVPGYQIQPLGSTYGVRWEFSN